MTFLAVGQKLPSFVVEKDGKILEGKKFTSWSSDELVGEANLLVIQAGTQVVSQRIESVMDMIKAGIDIKLTHVINSKESPMGAGMFIKGEFKKLIKKNSNNTYVHDSKAVAKEALEMADLSSLVIVTNAHGEIVFVQENETEAADVIAAIDSVK